jgi:hypothetical protein
MNTSQPQGIVPAQPGPEAVLPAAPAIPAPPVAAQPANPAYSAQLESEKVVVSAPLSFHGSAARIWKITQRATGGAQAALVALAVVLIALAWTFVLGWYAAWGLWLVPYRLIRRGSRKRKLDGLQHREMMAAIQAQQMSQFPQAHAPEDRR